MNETPSTATLPCRIAILGSGTGTNASAIVRYAQEHDAEGFTVALIVSTRPNVGIVEIAKRSRIPHVVIEDRGEEFTRRLLEALSERRIELIALAGFMRILDAKVIQAMNGAIVNVHPALLPRHGGKGMYGIHVHQAVVDSQDRMTGVTVHMVSERYDEGEIIAQRSVRVEPSDTAVSLQERVKLIEHELYPKAIAEHVRIMNLRGNSDQ
ncbi:phosphoribosylglycinamide formyltransferase [soil metagenome]